jgi:predicted nucleotidyltransferase
VKLSRQLRAKRGEILRIARSHGATDVRVFGSVARGEDHGRSDLDLLVELEPDRSLFDIIAIKQDVEDLLGRRVDVLTEDGLSRYIHDQVIREAVPL